MLKIRRPLGRLIFNMGIAIPGKTVFLIEMAPRQHLQRPCMKWNNSSLITDHLLKTVIYLFSREYVRFGIWNAMACLSIYSFLFCCSFARGSTTLVWRQPMIFMLNKNCCQLKRISGTRTSRELAGTFLFLIHKSVYMYIRPKPSPRCHISRTCA